MDEVHTYTSDIYTWIRDTVTRGYDSQLHVGTRDVVMDTASLGNHLLVAAFDFGTTYSGYAFSFRDQPFNIRTNNAWATGTDRLLSLKAPTCVLLDPTGKFAAFGFEAEDKFSSLVEDGDHHGWRLFSKFKMLLHNNKTLSRLSQIEDISGKPMAALPIFAMAIRYLRDHLLNAISLAATAVNETDIHYVITVPAIWDDDAKQFMREAATEAGIDSQRMKLALEPEAASIWCEQINVDVKTILAGQGTQYMCVDLGGGTADISVHERKSKGSLKEIHRASGGPWGGIVVDKNYLSFLETIFGEMALTKLREVEIGDYFDILRNFETKKRAFSSTYVDKMVFKIPSRLRALAEQYMGKTLEENLTALDYGSKVQLKGGDKLRVDIAIVKEWFDDPIDKTIKHITDVLAEPELQNVRSILLVGGFGESSYVKEKMSDALSDKCWLIVCEDAGLVVLKGAVRFGHEPSIIMSRIMKYTYGIGVSEEFDEEKHRTDKMYIKDGVKRAKNVFHVFVRKDDRVKVNDEVMLTSVLPTTQNKSSVTIYRTTDRYPVYTTDPGSEKLGKLKISHRDGDTVEDKLMNDTFIFGDTELMVKVKMQTSGREFRMRFDCLN